ncbi:MAG: peptidyl-prolyl cis-trans isomerase [Pseudomonadota bacterium]
MIALGLVLVGSCTCQGKPTESATRGSQASIPTVLSSTVDPSAMVVAEVNGSPIYDRDVAVQAKEYKTTPAQALQQLIDAELLVQEALRRGIDKDPEVQAICKRESARRYINLEFDARFTGPEDVPDEEVEKAWKLPNVKRHFDHDEVRFVTYVRVPARSEAPPEQRETARVQASEIYANLMAAAPAGSDTFVELAFAAGEAMGIKLERETLGAEPNSRLVKPFLDAAFAIPAAGSFSLPIDSGFGWDIIFLKEIVPPRHASLAEASSEIRAELFKQSRIRAFIRWADGLVASTKTERNDALLSGIEVESPVALE